MIAQPQRPPYLLSINPNLSLTNLAHMMAKGHHLPRPTGFAQFPMTPPRSKVLSPIYKKEATLAWLLFLPPVDWRVVILCAGWYLMLIISSNLTKMVLTLFPYPVTLTEAQFLFNCGYCLLVVVFLTFKPQVRSQFPRGTFPVEIPTIFKFVTPTRLVVATTLPMGCFQFVGHLTSHKATLMVPVSLVHTVKALLPLATVSAYRVLFKKQYKPITYITLTPLVFGIMVTCYKPLALNQSLYVAGLGYAFVLMMIFVSQNIFSKTRLTVEQSGLPAVLKKCEEKKVDKLTILFYCSLTGFLLTLPIYLLVEMRLATFSLGHMTHTVFFLMVVNGLSHFVQLFLAFQILGLMSPINYTIANIMKRIIIIVVAFLWELKQITGRQVFGLALTISGLYSYDRWGVEKTKSW